MNVSCTVSVRPIWQVVMDTARAIDAGVFWTFVGLAVAVKGIGILSSMYRWQLILRGQGIEFTFRHIFGTFLIGRAIGFFLRRSGYSVAGIVLGLILGKVGEQSFAQAMQMLYYDPIEFTTRPIASVLIIGGLATMTFNLVKAIRGPEPKPEAAGAD